jgi:hypothetical protein
VAVGNLESAWRVEKLFAGRAGRLLGMGTVPARITDALQRGAVLVQALLALTPLP